MWGAVLTLLLFTVGSVTPSCMFGDPDWKKGAPLLSEIAGQNKLVVDWSRLIRDEKCVDNYFVWVWRDQQTMTQGKKYTIKDFKTKTYTITIKPCINYNIRVQAQEKKETKDTDIARFNTAKIPIFSNSYIQTNFKVSYHKDPRSGEFDLTKASITLGNKLAEYASCIKHVEVTGKQGARAAGISVTTQRSYNLRSKTATAKTPTGSPPIKAFHWGQNVQNSSIIIWQPYGTGRQRSENGVPPLGMWASKDIHQGGGINHGGFEGSGLGVGGLRNVLRVTTSRPGVTTTTAWGYNPGANHRPTGGWKYPTTPKPSSYPGGGSSGQGLHPGQVKPGVWSHSTFDHVFPRQSVRPSSQTAGPVKKAITSSGNDVEIIISVEPCKEYTFEMKIVNIENEEMAKVTGLELPILSKVQDYIPPPLTSVIEMSFSKGKPVMDVKRQSPVPASCLPLYLETLDTFANRLEHIANFQSFKTQSITNYGTGFQTKLELTQEETLAKYGCKCASPHLEFKTTDIQLEQNPVFGHYHYQGMNQGYPYYKLVKHNHMSHHDPHEGTPLAHGHRRKRFVGLITTTERTTWRPAVSCDANCQHDNLKVCGYDGKWYQDQCEMDKQHCVGGRTYVTACKTRSCSAKCDQHAAGDHWLRSGKDRPVNRCGHIVCNRAYDPVCGSDGKTYSNECMLNLHNCENSGLVEVYRKTSCSRAGWVPTQPTTTQPPWNFGGGSVTRKTCDDYCPPSSQPVCGKDGVTYQSDCELTKSNCNSGQSVRACRTRSCKLKCSQNTPSPTIHTTPTSIVSTTSISQCQKSCRTRSCKARCGKNTPSPGIHTTPRPVVGTTPRSPWGTTPPPPKRETPMYLFWDGSNKQWAFGSKLGDSQTSEFASESNSRAKCPADPNNKSWQFRSSRRSSWTTKSSLELKCEDHV